MEKKLKVVRSKLQKPNGIYSSYRYDGEESLNSKIDNCKKE